MMLEWCYQGDNPEYIDDHYKSLEEKERIRREKTEEELKDLLGKNGPIVRINGDDESRRAS